MSSIQQCSIVNIDSWARLCEMSWQCRPITHLILLTMVVSKFACHICLRFAVFYPCNPLVKSFQLIPFNHSWTTHISSTATQLHIKLLTPPSCPVWTKKRLVISSVRLGVNVDTTKLNHVSLAEWTCWPHAPGQSGLRMSRDTCEW